jgi:hypothetical protein
MPLAATKPKMPADQVRIVWGCDPAAGVMWWAQRGKARQVGKVIGRLQDGRGYLTQTCQGKRYYLHHLMWAWVHGRWPLGVIDHVNRNPSDNRIDNLREVTSSRNNANCAVRRHSISKRKGVYRDKRDGRYYAFIDLDGDRQCLGGFQDADGAYEARRTAELTHYGEVLTEARSA